MISRKNFSRLPHLLLLLLIGIITYTSLPRVWQKKSAYGKALPDYPVLPDTVKAALRGYINDPIQHYSDDQQVVALWNEKIIFSYGNMTKLVNCHSARKSVMSLLIGIAKEKDYLSLDETLGDLGIDESNTPLSDQEKKATIRDLLMARSGVYLPAEAETDFAKANRPAREQYKPGEFFFYNNFDFNVLGAILEMKTGKSIGQFMEEYLAVPLGMEDFFPSNVIYGNPWPLRNVGSDFRVYWIYLSARDLARIGGLVAQKGKWNGQQIVSTDWIRESTMAYTTRLDESMWPFDAYGYLWWIDKDNNTIWADGFGGQFLLIDTTRNLAISQRNFTGNSLITSGLFLMQQKKFGGRRHLMHIFDVIRNYVPNAVDFESGSSTKAHAVSFRKTASRVSPSFLRVCKGASATILPLLTMTTLSHKASTSCIMCVENSTVLSLPSIRISSRISTNWLGSRPVVGSSRTNTGGW